jgi:hypothetical protein
MAAIVALAVSSLIFKNSFCNLEPEKLANLAPCNESRLTPKWGLPHWRMHESSIIVFDGTNHV